MVDAVAPSRAPPCALLAIGCCERWAGLTAKEVLQGALAMVGPVEVAPAVMVVAPAVVEVTWVVAAMAAVVAAECGRMYTPQVPRLLVRRRWLWPWVADTLIGRVWLWLWLWLVLRHATECWRMYTPQVPRLLVRRRWRCPWDADTMIGRKWLWLWLWLVPRRSEHTVGLTT